ncbi:hypothetical protein TBR22_A31580 [Luteitalea sp. TBR-22]|nr:hypothetical protein TBR22_A31580 [Luteitalea sp. TBR-22]
MALALYALAAVVATWPLAWRPRTLLGAPQGAGDPYLNLFTLGWDLRQLFASPGSWLDGRVFDAPIFHPARQALAFTDHLLLQALLVSPVYAVWRDPLLCYNVVFIASIAASAWAMWWYLRQVLDDGMGPLVGGIAWGFCAYRFSHVLHLQLQALYFLPLAFGALHRVVARRRWQDGAWLGLWYGLGALSSVYYAVIGLVALAIGGLALVAGAGRVSLGRLLAPLLVGGVVATALVGPVLVPYLQVQQREGFVRTMDEASRHAATPLSLVSEPPWRPVALAPIGRTEEDGLHPGWGASLLALLAVAALARSRRQPLLWTWAAVALAGVVLALGPDGVRPVYAFAHRWVFGFQGVRAPARFGVLLAFGVAAAAGFAVTWWRRETRSTLRPLVLGLAAIVVVEGLAWRIPYVPAPSLVTPVSAWLRDADGPGPVAFLPQPEDRAATPLMLGTLVHGRPIVNGYSGQRPAFAGAVAGALATFPSADAIWTLHDLGVRFVVAGQDGLQDAWPLTRRARVPGDEGHDEVIYELADEATLLAAVGAPATVAAPAPGTPGFAPGEVSRYDVFWDGAGTQVSAGTIEIAVLSASGADVRLPRWLPQADRARIRYEARVSLETAPWVARFFEARDVFRTYTDDQFRPIVHLREIREGRRQVDQSVYHDGAGGVVRVVPPEAASVDAGPGFRAPTDARDPIAALLLVRTLALAAGAEVAVPVNDMGRNLTLQSGPLQAETIEWRGQRVPALHMRPALVQRVQRRAPPAIDLWLSADERRLPLRIDVAAGFGRVRVELIESRPGAPRT